MVDLRWPGQHQSQLKPAVAQTFELKIEAQTTQFDGHFKVHDIYYLCECMN